MENNINWLKLDNRGFINFKGNNSNDHSRP